MTPALTSNGYVVDHGPSTFGSLRDSTPHAADGPELRERLAQDGYVFLRGLLDVSVLRRVQKLVGAELSRLGVLDAAGDRGAHMFPARRGACLYRVLDGLSKIELRALTRQPALVEVFTRIFGEDVRPLDYHWPRVAGPGRAELPHCDWIYMCRGTTNLLSAWMPLMDMPLTLGPLMILENSHRDNLLTRSYLKMDADRLGIFDAVRVKHGMLLRGGTYSKRPDRTREEFGTRWLSADFAMGDVVIFSTRCLHATLDNRTGGFRASIDVRFQPAREAADPRFDGPHPIAHTERDWSIFDLYTRLKRTLSRFRAEARAPHAEHR
ncbi:MAG TPA: phytanoyl-CoA dioxygenase family protein [Gammaproteobacteria bacterium]